MDSFDISSHSLFDFSMLVLMASFRFYINLFSCFTPWSLALLLLKVTASKCISSDLLGFFWVAWFVWFFFLFCWFCFLVVCMDFRIAVGTELDSHHAWTCINLSHLLNWHSKSPRFDSSFHFLGLFPEQEQTCNWGRERVLTWTSGGVTFLAAVLLGCPCPTPC